MGLKSLMQDLKNWVDVPCVSSEKSVEDTRKPAWIGVVPSVPLQFADAHETVQIGQLGEAVNDSAKAAELMVNPQVTAKTPGPSGKLSTLLCTKPMALPDPDRWCWPYSAAMTGKEIDTLIERTALFSRRGLSALDAELLADKLVNRDREGDDRRLCLECAHLNRPAGTLHCAQWQRAGLGAPGVPAGLHLVLQRCNGFKDQNPQRTTS